MPEYFWLPGNIKKRRKSETFRQGLPGRLERTVTRTLWHSTAVTLQETLKSMTKIHLNFSLVESCVMCGNVKEHEFNIRT